MGPKLTNKAHKVTEVLAALPVPAMCAIRWPKRAAGETGQRAAGVWKGLSPRRPALFGLHVERHRPGTQGAVWAPRGEEPRPS